MGMWFAPKDSGQFSANFDKQTDFDHRKNPFKYDPPHRAKFTSNGFL